ncbi:hypothetical protein NO938_005298 [Citrobacter freundii]|nr:hypothetical protein [Citrobacter freundii]EKW0770597.1 hypothetical protein [Citrobacter freundii]
MTTNNHPTHGPVSLDRLHQIHEILSKAAKQSDGGNLGYAMADAVKVIDSAIAAFGAEPVAWKVVFMLHGHDGSNFEKIFENREAMNDVVSLHELGGFDVTATPLYRAAMLQAGNSPATPDGYVLVTKELTCAMDDAAWEAYHETRCMSDIWAALLAAAPQQEG